MTIIRFASEFSGTQQAVNVWHFDCGGAATTSLANECIVKVDTFLEAIKAFLAAGTYTTGSRVVTVDQTPNAVVAATALTCVSSGVGNAPRQVAAGVSWRTAFIGRSFRGRNYIGPLASGAVASDGLNLNSTFASDLLTAAGNLRTVTTGGAQLCVWSERLQAANVVTGAAVPLSLRTQRRRLT